RTVDERPVPRGCAMSSSGAMPGAAVPALSRSFGVRSLRSGAVAVAAPLAALVVTVVVGAVLFSAMGKSPGAALAMFLVEPLRGGGALTELCVKATPLALIAVGLSIAFRANAWNIGGGGRHIAAAVAGPASA